LAQPNPHRRETSCTEGNNQIVIGKENYYGARMGSDACQKGTQDANREES
jgi:hypothetical protein